MADEEFARTYLARSFGMTVDDATLTLVAGLIGKTPRVLEAPLAEARAATAEGTLFDVAPNQHAALMHGKEPVR
ncbi:MAG: hypothetical protein LPL00_09875 [Alphaproteobacteria bacterium]|nr:hypothetical protein [Alphaproteobacteria bacterium]MDX5369978.1 hypothetical protein [Alphaproteobacteria bacterium]MDX5464556.1 hypothetical protein [Alphaproteobacteria bacterium]